jgi:hypothetical protein
MTRPRSGWPAAALVSFAACSSAPTTTDHRLPLPVRTASVPGTTIAAELATAPLAERERRVLAHFDAGNVPSFVATLVPVPLQARVGERERAAIVWCSADYFGIGTDADWLRMPTTPQLAQRLADRLDATLPTRRLVDAIRAAATVVLAPQPFHPREHAIASMPVFAASHAAIEAQRGDAPRDELTAGHKKDVVLSARLHEQPDRVAIYGWHRLDGTPIQPLWLGHTTVHVDYSHGIRFVARAMLLDGIATTVDAVLADPELHVLLSDEGPIAPARHPDRR